MKNIDFRRELLAKRSILDVCQSSDYASVDELKAIIRRNKKFEWMNKCNISYFFV